MTDDAGSPRQTRDSIRDIWGPRTPFRDEGEWPPRVDERVLEPPDRWVQSACVLCSNGCALDIGVKGGRIVGVRGRAVDRINRGRLGPKGLHGWIANHGPGRLERPLVRRGGRLVEASWDEAMGQIVDRSAASSCAATAPCPWPSTTPGRLFLEEYWALAAIVRAGVGTPHLDGNTRLCTATAANALIESFGTDGDPGSYTDLDVTDAVLLVGHNMASTQTVLWARLLDRLEGPAPPRLVVIDPRTTPTAERADVHLAPRLGTNLAVLDGLLHLLIEHGRIDRAFIDAHTVGFETLRRTVAQWPPARVEAVADVPRDELRAAARVLGEAPTLVSTVLQGVYQSHQATAAAVQVNNLNLLRGMIGKPCSTAYLQAEDPAHPTARAWNIGVGQLAGCALGFLAVWLLGAADAPAALESGELAPVRLAAAVLAFAATLLVTVALKAAHPAAGATTLLVALGSLRTLEHVAALALGTVILIGVGEALAHLRRGQRPEPAPGGEAGGIPSLQPEPAARYA